jgi:hypothetical protein
VELHGCLVESLSALTKELEQVGEVVLVDCVLVDCLVDQQRVSLRLQNGATFCDVITLDQAFEKLDH